MKLAAPLLIAALAAALLAGCGSSSEEETQRTANAPAGASVDACDTYAVDAEGLRVTGLSCKEGRQVMLGWQRTEDCGLIGGASRGACSVRSYRCLATRADRGISVSCARPGRSVAFVAKRG
jgi:hypothetical protein